MVEKKKAHITLMLVLGVIVLIATNSCSKPASNLIVGKWKIVDNYYYEYYDDYFQGHESSLDGKIWEFNSNGTLNCFFYGDYYDDYYDYHYYYTTSCIGTYSVNGPEIYIGYSTIDSTSSANCYGRIVEMDEYSMTIRFEINDSGLPFSWIYLYFVRTDEDPSQGGSGINELSFELYDSYGDGWNGAYLTVGYPDGNEETMTIENGSYASFHHTLFDGDVVWLEWHHGGDDQECSFDIFYEDGSFAFQHTGGFEGRMEFTVTP